MNVVLIEPEIHFNTGNVGRTSTQRRNVEAAESVFNVAAGAQYFFTDGFSLLGGFATDFSSIAPFGSEGFEDQLVNTKKDQ